MPKSPSSTVFQPVISLGVSDNAANLERQFMGLEILPELALDQKTATVPKFPIGNDTKSTSALKRSPKGGYDRIEFSIDSFTYLCEEYGLEEPMDDSDKRYLANFIGAGVDDSTLIWLMLRRQQEKRIAALTFNASTFAGYTGNVTTEWSNIAGTPFADVRTALDTIESNLGGVIGLGEICLAMSKKVFTNVTKTTEIKALRAGGNGAPKGSIVTPIEAPELAQLLGIDRVFYSPAKENTVDIWDDEFALLYVRYTGTSVNMVPHIGRSVRWTQDCPVNPIVETYRDDKVRSDILRVRQNFDEVVFNAAAGYLLSNITS